MDTVHYEIVNHPCDSDINLSKKFDLHHCSGWAIYDNGGKKAETTQHALLSKSSHAYISRENSIEGNFIQTTFLKPGSREGIAEERMLFKQTLGLATATFIFACIPVGHWKVTPSESIKFYNSRWHCYRDETNKRIHFGDHFLRQKF